jgi:hypothetical protein
MGAFFALTPSRAGDGSGFAPLDPPRRMSPRCAYPIRSRRSGTNPQLHTPEPDPPSAAGTKHFPDDGSTVVRSGLWYSFGLVTVPALILVWRSRLAGEFIQALGSRGELPKYRHRINWRG